MKRKEKRFCKKACACLLAAAVAAGTVTPTPNALAAASSKITISNVTGSTLVLKQGKSFTLQVKVNGKSGQKINYTSSNTKLVKISPKGKLKALKKGTAKISIKSTGKASKKMTLKVIVGTPVSKIVLSDNSLTGAVGDKLTLKASVKPKNASIKGISFTSKNKNIATVNAKGKITCKKEGSTKIQAISKDGNGKKATCKITVTASEQATSAPASSAAVTATSPAISQAPESTASAGSIGGTNSSAAPVGQTTAPGQTDGPAAPDSTGSVPGTAAPAQSSNPDASSPADTGQTSNPDASSPADAGQTSNPESTEPAVSESPVPTEAASISYEDYTLKWEDEFTGSTLNKNDWNVELHEPGWVNAELQAYVDSEENIYVKDGKLYLVPIETIGTDGEKTYTSGRVNTQGKHDFKYGMFEVKAKVPAGKGYLPAFWMMPTNESLYGQWPKCGEIDAMEVMGQNTDKLYGTIHYGAPHAETQGTYLNESESSFSDDFHTFTVEWEPDHITWYVDGFKYHEANDWFSAVEGGGKLTYPAPFDQPFYMILNLAVGGSWVGYPDDSTSYGEEAAFVIDSVKAYQKSEDYYEAAEANATANYQEKTVTYKEADADGNYVTNGDFSTDINKDTDWELHLEDDAADTTYEVKDQAITISPQKIGGQTYSVQLKQPGMPLYEGLEYTLTFDAKADTARSIVVDVEGPDKNWVRYLADTTVDLSTEKKTYTYTFTMDQATDANGCLEFNLGNQGSTDAVSISNVSLKVSGGEKVDENIKKVRADGNYVYNGSFQEGKNRLDFWEIPETDKAAVSVTNTDNDRRLKITAPEGTSSSNPVTITQSGLPLTDGTYSLSYQAYKEDAAENEQSFTIKVGNTTFTDDLTTDPEKSYSHTFTFGEDEDNTIALTFTAPGTYYVDNIILAEDAMIKNGSFNAGKSGYAEYVDTSANVTESVVDSQREKDAYSITILDTGNQNWHIQLNQKGITLEKDKWYKLTLDAKCNIDRDIDVCIQHNGGADGTGDDVWTGYNPKTTFSLEKDTFDQGTGVFQQYESIFKMSADTDPNVMLSIAMGAVGGKQITDLHTIFIDNISLVETEPVETPDVEAGVNLLTNADFSEEFWNDWSENISSGDGAEAVRSIEDGAITYDISSVGTADWNIQLKQGGLNLKAGDTYKVSFKITSSADRIVKSGVMSTTYDWHGGTDIHLTADTEQTAEYTFTMNDDDPAADFYISMGQIKDDATGENIETPASKITISELHFEKVSA